ncbi:MAG: hypothetical protein ACO3E1_08195 [Flavobacteriales bacterium]
MKTFSSTILLSITFLLFSCTEEKTTQSASNIDNKQTDSLPAMNDAQKAVEEVKKESEKSKPKSQKKQLADIFVYSKEGKLVEKIVYTIKNGKHIKNVYKYNAVGRKIAWDKYNEKGTLEETVVFKELPAAPKKNAQSKEQEAQFKFAFKFNEQGKRTEWKSFNDDGSLGHSFSYKYDKAGREIEWKSVGANGQTEATNTYLYDDQGRKSEWQHFNEKNEMDYKYIYSYDESGKQSAKLTQIAPNEKLFLDKEVK